MTIDHIQSSVTPEAGVSTQLNNKFSPDIRSYALILLEIVCAWNKQNGKMIILEIMKVLISG